LIADCNILLMPAVHQGAVGDPGAWVRAGEIRFSLKRRPFRLKIERLTRDQLTGTHWESAGDGNMPREALNGMAGEAASSPKTQYRQY
jgi:hypothetical protein